MSSFSVCRKKQDPIIESRKLPFVTFVRLLPLVKNLSIYLMLIR